jgi:hypothetical protein
MNHIPEVRTIVKNAAKDGMTLKTQNVFVFMESITRRKSYWRDLMRYKSKDYYLGEYTAGTAICVPMPEHIKRSLKSVSSAEGISMARFSLQLIIEKLAEKDDRVKEWQNSISE